MINVLNPASQLASCTIFSGLQDRQYDLNQGFMLLGSEKQRNRGVVQQELKNVVFNDITMKRRRNLRDMTDVVTEMIGNTFGKPLL